MTPERYRQIREHFLRIRELDHSQQPTALLECEPWICDEVKALLAAENASESFLAIGDSDESDTTMITPASGANPPSKVGAYRILHLLGEGGFGAVYLAEQDHPIQRRVAIKLIKPGMDSKQVLNRFQAERQALAMMEHSAIAKVLDAGATDSGAPYFVMELVQGKPIDEFCDTHQLGLKERIELFLQVCQGVHHAHQKGVIHRDIKPSNVLATYEAKRAVVKVIDFGIAKALDSRLSDETLVTQFGQMMGTLEYMSPEQADMSSQEPDTRSDVYSLGVLLYKLLSGRTPISKSQLLENGVYEILRCLQETEPPKVSDCVPGMEKAQQDLDWIAMKSLAKEPQHRYDSAKDLADDLRRYLNGMPVVAHPPTWRYRLRKFTRRNRAFTAVFLAIAVGGCLGIAGLILGWQQSIRSALEAQQSQRMLAESVYPQLLQSAWSSALQRDPKRASEFLENCLPELRGWEWQFVQNENSRELGATLRSAGQAAITLLDYDGKQRRFACVISDGRVEVRDAANGDLLREIHGDYLVNVARWSMDGSRLLLGTNEGEIRVLSVADGEEIESKQLSMGGVYDIGVSRDGRQIVACTGGSSLVRMDSETLGVLQTWDLPTRLSQVRRDPDGLRWSGIGHDGGLYLFAAGDPEYKRTVVCNGMARDFRWLPDNRVAVLTPKAVVSVSLDNLDGAPQVLVGDAPTFCALTSTETGTLYMGGSDGAVEKLAPGEPPKRLQQLGFAITESLWLSGEQVLLVALSDGRLLRLKEQPEIAGWSAELNARLAAMVVSNKYDVALAFDQGGKLQGFNLQSGLLSEARLESTAKSGWMAALSKNEQIVATIGEERCLQVFALPELKKEFEAEIGWGVRTVCVSNSGNWVAAGPPAQGYGEGAIGIWDVASGKCIQILKGHPNWVVGMALTSDGRRLISTDVNGEVCVWNTETWNKAFSIVTKRAVPELVEVDDKGGRFILGHRDGWVSIWDLQNGTLQDQWQPFGDGLSGLSLLPGNRLVFTSRSSGEVQVVNVTNRQLLAKFPLAQQFIQYFKVFQGGRYVATQLRDGSFAFRDLANGGS